MSKTTKQLKSKGLDAHKIAYWQKKLPGASASQILKARGKQVYNHNPNAFGQGLNLTPNQLNSQVNANTKLQFGDTENQLHTSQGQTDPIYDAYAKSIFNAQAASQAAATAANTAITTNAGNLETQNNASRSQLLAQMQADAAKRGASIDPSLFANDVAASASRQERANTQANLSTQLGANQQQFLTGQGALGEGARAQRKLSLADQLKQLASQEGAFKVSQRADILKSATQNAQANAALGIQMKNANTSANLAKGNLGFKKVAAKQNQQKINNTSAKNQHDTMLADAKFGLDQKKYGSAQAKDIYQRQHGLGPYSKGKGGKGSTGTTHTQRVSAKNNYDQALSLIRTKNKGKTNINPQSEADLIQTSKHNIPYDLALAAAQQYKNGGVDYKTATAIFKKYGIRLKGLNPKAYGGPPPDRIG